MKIFIWNKVNDMSRFYHSSGGIAVVARDLEHARKMIGSQLREDCEAIVKDPDASYEVVSDKPEIFDFPDAGCC